MNSARYLAGRFVGSLRLGCKTLHMPVPALTSHNFISHTPNISAFKVGTRLTSTSASSSFEVFNVQDEKDFKKRVIDASSSTPIVVDFHATWCGPCKLLGPRLESILSETKGKVVMAMVDIDDNSELAVEYGVRSVPTVIGVKNGKVHNQFVGLIDDDQIRTFIDKLVIS